MDLGLTGKAALVTGSSKGIGRAIAHALAREGCRVALSSRGGADLDRAVAEAKQLGAGAIGLVGDLSTQPGVDAVARGALEAFGEIDILINNVGGSAGRGGAFADAAAGDLEAVLGVNLTPAWAMSLALLPQMKRRSAGSIVMVTSIWGREAGPGATYNVAKAAAKAAEISLAKGMSRELARDGIRVNSVAPGSTLFPGGAWDLWARSAPDDAAAFVARELPFGRFGTAEEIADVVAFVASPRASWIVGSCVVVDGGQSRMF